MTTAINNFSLKEYQYETVESLNKKVFSLQNKAFALSALLKISIVAFLAIVGLVLYQSYILGSTSSRPMAALTFSTPLVSKGVSWLFAKEAQYEKEARFYQDLSHRLKGKVTPLDALLEYLNPFPFSFSFTSPQVPDPQLKFFLQSRAHDQAYTRYESQTIPRALQAATVLQFKKDPTQNIDIVPFGLTLPGVGTCHPRSYGEREFGRKKLQNDDYFSFENPKKGNLLLSAIEKRDPEELRKLLFSKNNQNLREI